MKSRGFTLIELAIVMIVIGLLTAGVLMGQTLIRQSELSGVVTTLEKISSVTRTFQKKYQYLPGDLPDATSFWGIQAGTGNDDVCYLSESTTQTTCNGNGDGIVNRGHTNTGWHERTRYWQQLANEGLITGRYTGVQGLDGSVTRAGGVNVMKAEWENTNYGLGWNAFIAADPNYYEQSLQHHISNALDWRTARKCS